VRKGWQSTMKFLIDTNVIIDYLADRSPFAEDAERIIELCINGKAEGMLTANAVTDIYYVLHKHIGRDKALKNLRVLFDILSIVDITQNDIFKAMNMDITDFEDAIAVVCAKRVKADYIVTRNEKDFANSEVQPITPKSFLALYY